MEDQKRGTGPFEARAADLVSEYASFITGETVVIGGGTWLSKGYYPYFIPALL